MRISVRFVRRGVKGFKHVDRAVADAFAEGTVKIGTYEHYRALEGQRGDRMEGRVFLRQQGTIEGRVDQLSEAQRAAIDAMWIGIPPDNAGMNVQIGHNTCEIFLPPCYIFCCSEQPDYELAERTDQAIFEIQDLKSFGQAIADAHPELLKHPVVKPVSYLPREGDPLVVGALLPDPFVKPEEFAHEREIRVIWAPAKPPEPFAILHVPALARLVTRLH